MNGDKEFDGTRVGRMKMPGAVRSGTKQFGYLGRGRKAAGSNPVRIARHARSNVSTGWAGGARM
jgi:hypothetical protein